MISAGERRAVLVCPAPRYCSRLSKWLANCVDPQLQSQGYIIKIISVFSPCYAMTPPAAYSCWCLIHPLSFVFSGMFFALVCCHPRYASRLHKYAPASILFHTRLMLSRKLSRSWYWRRSPWRTLVRFYVLYRYLSHVKMCLLWLHCAYNGPHQAHIPLSFTNSRKSPYRIRSILFRENMLSDRTHLNNYNESQLASHLFQFTKSTNVYFKELFRTDLPSVHRPSLHSTEDSVTLVFRNRGENAGARRVSVESLDDASLLVIVREQADMTIPKGLSDDNGSLLRVEVALAGLAGGQSAANGSAVATRWEVKLTTSAKIYTWTNSFNSRVPSGATLNATFPAMTWPPMADRVIAMRLMNCIVCCWLRNIKGSLDADFLLEIKDLIYLRWLVLA